MLEKNVKQVQFSHIAGGNPKLYSRFQKQFGNI